MIPRPRTWGPLPPDGGDVRQGPGQFAPFPRLPTHGALWRAAPPATGPGGGAVHCWALRGAATRRARAGGHSRCRWARAGVSVDVSTCRGPRARRAGIGAGCARPTRAPPTRPAHGGVHRARHTRPRPPSEATRRSVGGPKAPPGARQPLAPSPTATAAPPNAVPTTPSATGLPPPAPTSHHPHHRHRPPARTTRTTRPAPAPLRHCTHHLGPRHAGRTRARPGLSGATAG